MTNSEQMEAWRAQFEAWACERILCYTTEQIRGTDGKYILSTTQARWEGFLAAKQSEQVPEPATRCIACGTRFTLDEPTDLPKCLRCRVKEKWESRNRDKTFPGATLPSDGRLFGVPPKPEAMGNTVTRPDSAEDAFTFAMQIKAEGSLRECERMILTRQQRISEQVARAAAEFMEDRLCGGLPEHRALIEQAVSHALSASTDDTTRKAREAFYEAARTWFEGINWQGRVSQELMPVMDAWERLCAAESQKETDDE